MTDIPSDKALVTVDKKPDKRRKFSSPQRKRFLKHFAATGLHYQSADAAGVTGETVYQELRRNPDFKIQYQEAKERHSELVVQELKRRAIVGVDKPVFYKGRNVGHVREYSDRLMELLVKREDASFIEKRAIIAAIKGDEEKSRNDLEAETKIVDLKKLSPVQRMHLKRLLSSVEDSEAES